MAFPIPQPTVRERAADSVGQAKTLDRAIGEIRIQESGGACGGQSRTVSKPATRIRRL
ncbi:hypothetical protein K100096D8_12960 [Eggerthella lenta]